VVPVTRPGMSCAARYAVALTNSDLQYRFGEGQVAGGVSAGGTLLLASCSLPGTQGRCAVCWSVLLLVSVGDTHTLYP
jgi:hypothetical protein